MQIGFGLIVMAIVLIVASYAAPKSSTPAVGTAHSDTQTLAANR